MKIGLRGVVTSSAFLYCLLVFDACKFIEAVMIALQYPLITSSAAREHGLSAIANLVEGHMGNSSQMGQLGACAGACSGVQVITGVVIY